MNFWPLTALKHLIVMRMTQVLTEVIFKLYSDSDEDLKILKFNKVATYIYVVE